MPIGIIGSLILSMIVYVSLSLVVCGMAPIAILAATNTTISNAFMANSCCTVQEMHTDLDHFNEGLESEYSCLNCSSGENLDVTLYFGSKVIQFGAMFGLTAACFTCLMGQPRIFYRMAKDGLLFEAFGKVDSKSNVPVFGTVITGLFVACAAVFVDLESLATMISLGTLQVFTFVNTGVIILRTTR